MWLNQLPTLVNLSLWDATSNRNVRCVCGAVGTDAHIFSGACPRIRGLKTALHNAVGHIIRQTLVKRNMVSWSFVSESDTHAPEWLAGVDWKEKIPFVSEEEPDGRVRRVQHYKPDLIVADCLSPQRSVVYLVDFTFVRDDLIREAECHKIVIYQSMCEVIIQALGPGDHVVEVVPVAVGRSGVPPPEWANVCQKLKMLGSPMSIWDKVMTCLMQQNMHMFKCWQKHNGLA